MNTKPQTTTEKQATQMRRMAGVRSVEEAEVVADAAARKRRPYVETGDHQPVERPKKRPLTERQAESILRGL